MKTYKKQFSKQIVIASLVTVLTVLALLYFTVGKDFFNQNKNIEVTNTQTDGKQNSTNVNNNPVSVPGVTDNSTKADTKVNTDPDGPNIVITSSSQNGPVFQVRVLINTVLGSGSCKILFTRENFASVEKIVDTQAGPSSTTCKGFDIPLNELSVGSWNMKVIYTFENYSVESAKTIEIK